MGKTLEITEKKNKTCVRIGSEHDVLKEFAQYFIECHVRKKSVMLIRSLGQTQNMQCSFVSVG